VHWIGVVWWISCYNRSIALLRSASEHVVAACLALFRRTWNCLHFDVVTISAPYTRTSIAAQIIEIYCSCNWWDSITNCSFTLVFAHFDIFWSLTTPVFLSNPSSVSSSTMRDKSEWFCSLTRRENSHNTHTTPITISSEAVSAGGFLLSLEKSRIAVQFSLSSDYALDLFTLPGDAFHRIECCRAPLEA